MRIEASSELASASLARYQPGQHARCTHARPIDSVPKGSNGSQGPSPPPQARQRPGMDVIGFRLSHSTTQQAYARSSASARANPPSNSAMAARSSKKTSQSSGDQLSSAGENSLR